MHKWSPFLLRVLRIVAGLLFTCHGTQKLLAFPAAAAQHAGGHAMSEMAVKLAPFSGYIELIGGALVLFGLFTRFAAFIVSGEMAVAYFTAHAPNGLWPIQNGGEVAVLYCFIFLYLVFAGAGPISLDGLIRKKA
jgi:putative oxidoreductase